jgi:predicted permease
LKRVIVEELIRSLAAFFLFYVLAIVVASQVFHGSTISLYVVFGVPLFFALIHFPFFVYMRMKTGKDYHFRRGSVEYRGMMVGVTICCFSLSLLGGVRNITGGNPVIGLVWLIFGIACGVWGIREIYIKEVDA